MGRDPSRNSKDRLCKAPGWNLRPIIQLSSEIHLTILQISQMSGLHDRLRGLFDIYIYIFFFLLLLLLSFFLKTFHHSFIWTLEMGIFGGRMEGKLPVSRLLCFLLF